MSNIIAAHKLLDLNLVAGELKFKLPNVFTSSLINDISSQLEAVYSIYDLGVFSHGLDIQQ